jgi:hypothetical protein
VAGDSQGDVPALEVVGEPPGVYCLSREQPGDPLGSTIIGGALALLALAPIRLADRREQGVELLDLEALEPMQKRNVKWTLAPCRAEQEFGE